MIGSKKTMQDYNYILDDDLRLTATASTNIIMNNYGGVNNNVNTNPNSLNNNNDYAELSDELFEIDKGECVYYGQLQ